MISGADPASPSRQPRHHAGFSFALSLARQHLTGQSSGIASVTPRIRTLAACCAIALQTHAARKAGSSTCALRSLAWPAGGLGPCRAARARRKTSPRLRALCVDFHAGERLGAGIGSPRQHWPRAVFWILFAILHFPSDPFTFAAPAFWERKYSAVSKTTRPVCI